LAAGAVVMGFLLFVPHWLADYAPFEHWLEPSTAAMHSSFQGGLAHGSEAAAGHGEEHGGSVGLEIGLALLSVLIAAFALFGLARPWFTTKLGATEPLKRQFAPLYQFYFNKWFIDEFYHKTIVIPGVALSLFAWKLFDVRIIDGIVNGVAYVIGGLGQAVRPLQTGFVRNYALYLLAGAVVYLAYSFVK
jgi:NADH-quinone oxidoreductase subunit L